MRLRDFLTPPVFADETRTRKAWVLHIILWSTIVGVTLMELVDIVTLPEHTARWIGIIVFVDSIYLLVIVLNRRGRVQLASGLAVFSMWALVTVLIATEGVLHAPEASAYLLIVFAAGLLLGTGAGIFTGILCTVTTFIFVWLEFSGHFFPKQVLHTTFTFWSTQVFYTALIISLQWLATKSINDSLRLAQHELAERKRYEEQLKNVTERLRLATEAADIGVWDWDLSSNQVLCDARMFKIYGLPVTRYEQWASMVHPEDLPGQEAALQRTIQNQGHGHREFRIFRPDGEVRHIQAAEAVVVDAAGKPSRAVGINIDITERRRAEKLLRENVERFRIVIKQTGQLVYDFDVATGRIQWQGAIEQLTGFSAEEFQGVDIERWEEMIHPEDRSKVMLLLKKAQDASGSFRVEYRFRCQGGDYIYVEDHGAFLSDRSGKAVRMLGTMSNITSRKKVEEENLELTRSLEQRVQERTAELEATNKEIKTFSYSVSHDLRAPLRAILGFSEVLQEEYGSQMAPDASQLLHFIRTNAERMSQLIDDMLMFSRMGRQPLSKTRLDLQKLATEVADELRQQEKQRDLKLTIGPLPECYGDPSLIRQVFMNLLSNALKFTARRHPAEIEVNTQKRDGEDVFFVRDNGAGFNMEQAARLFAPFERLHSAKDFEGTGIGLSIVERIIQRHGGRVWAEGKVDQGATFYFTLPKPAPVQTA